MKLLANENFPFESVKYLKEKGFDIKYIGIDYPSVFDKEVISIAIRENRTILTFDRDYGELIFKYNYRPNKGVIYLRLIKYSPLEPGRIIAHILKRKDFKPERKLSVIDKHGIRQRKY